MTLLWGRGQPQRMTDRLPLTIKNYHVHSPHLPACYAFKFIFRHYNSFTDSFWDITNSFCYVTQLNTLKIEQNRMEMLRALDD